MKITRKELSNLRMVAGNEKKYGKVIMGGVLKEWIGFGWIVLRIATEKDRKRYPEVVE